MVVEDQVNVTWRCSVARGTRVSFVWLKDHVRVVASPWLQLSSDNSSLVLRPVKRQHRGLYHCVVSNAISSSRSRAAQLSVYYGPYDLAVRSAHGLRTGQVFTISPGELAHFECQADSNPPNTCVWMSKSHNGSQVIGEGPRLQLRSLRLAQAEEYLCRAFNNVTHKQQEAHFTLVVASLGTGAVIGPDASRSSALTVLTVFSLLCVTGLLLLMFRKHCSPTRATMSIYSRRSTTERNRQHCSGHEDAAEDFGIYEFVSLPSRAESAQVLSVPQFPSRPVPHQDMTCTIYEVIRHVPDLRS